ncbi:MAG: type II toxin-antitoxin system Phd/YefM family antitoxin [Deinococcota bacterium]|nr:type II toxin-antitoxin system Phd/YefM family antitoxin [Deinococcota bacterium]
MPIQTTYTNARANLAKLLDEVSNNHETIIITRRGAEDVVLISAAELSSLAETVHLLRSPKNAERLLTALHRALAGSDEPQAVEALRQDVGLGEKA